MKSNPTSKQSWVSDINQSAANIKRKENVNKIIKYCVVSFGFIMVIFYSLFLGKSKLGIINYKFMYNNKESIIDDSLEYKKNIIKEKLPPQHNLNTTRKKENITNEINQSTYLPKSFTKQQTIKNKLNKETNQLVKETSNSKNGKYITYYDNGKKWVELYFLNGLREGTQYSWHKNGQLKSELNYLKGKKHGSQKWWRKNGIILNEKIYVNGEWRKN